MSNQPEAVTCLQRKRRWWRSAEACLVHCLAPKQLGRCGKTDEQQQQWRLIALPEFRKQHEVIQICTGAKPPSVPLACEGFNVHDRHTASC